MKFFGKLNKETQSVVKSKNEVESRIKILGPGCNNCQRLEANTQAAINELGLDIGIAHVTDFQEIANYQIMSTPGLVLDEKVISFGRVLTKEEVKNLLVEQLNLN